MQCNPELQSAVATCLREPLNVTRTLLRSNRVFVAASDKRRHTPVSKRSLRNHLSGFCFPQQELVADLMHNDPRSRIIAAYHFGDYVYGMHYFATRFRNEQEFSYLSLESGNDTYFRNLRHAFGKDALGRDAQYVRSRTGATKLSSLLKRQSHNLILFCDLPCERGEDTEVDFLYRPARFCRGPATLALVNRVPILPVINFRDGNRHSIWAAPQIEPELGRTESLADAVRRVTHSLVNVLEKFLTLDPAQWRYLEILPRYFLLVRPGQTLKTF